MYIVNVVRYFEVWNKLTVHFPHYRDNAAEKLKNNIFKMCVFSVLILLIWRKTSGRCEWIPSRENKIERENMQSLE